MAKSHIASRTIAEMREFASFTASEQFFIERSLDLALDRCETFRSGSRASTQRSATWTQFAGYRDLRAMRAELVRDLPIEQTEASFAALVRISAQDLARGQIHSFDAYRFLYERILGARVRPYLPAAFCAAAALPQIAPVRRKALLETMAEHYVTTLEWSIREPVFFPCTVCDEAA